MTPAWHRLDAVALLAERVRAQRLHRGLSLHALAAQLAAGRDREALAQRLFRLEHAKRPDLRLAAEIAQVFGVPLAALLAASALEAALYTALTRLTPAQRLRLLLRLQRQRGA